MLFFYYFSEKIRLGISCISPARQMIRMKCQVLFSLNITNKKIKMSSVVIRLLDPGCGYKFSYLMTNCADPDQLASSEAK